MLIKSEIDSCYYHKFDVTLMMICTAIRLIAETISHTCHNIKFNSTFKVSRILYKYIIFSLIVCLLVD